MSRYRPDKTRSQIVFDSSDDQFYSSMNLSTIPNKKPYERQKGESTILKTDDIDGAKYVSPRINVRNTNLDITDIPGTVTKPMVNESKPAKDLLAIDDIDGAKPKIQRQLPHSNRKINPVDPVYELPSSKKEEYPVPKFIRDNMKNDDVEGASPKPYLSDKPPRDIMRLDDIIGYKPKQTIQRDSKTNFSFDVTDINTDGQFRSKRVTNPLTPEYFFNSEVITDDFGRAKPPPKGHSTPYHPLDVTDIPGATADSASMKFRTFKAESPKEDEKSGPTEILMLPSMAKQTEELRRAQEAARIRGEKIKFYENRNLKADKNGTDPAQSLLRQQREENRKRGNLTFGD